MIRINLLGQARPKAAKQAVPLEATMQVIFLLVALWRRAGVVLGIIYYQQKRELDETNAQIAALQAEKASLQQIKQDVDRFESQKGRAAAAHRRDRNAAEEPHRRPGLAADGGQHGGARRRSG